MQVPFEKNSEGKYALVRRVYNWYGKKPTDTAYVEVDNIVASLRVKDVHTTGNGYAYIEWESVENIIYYSNLTDFKKILTKITAQNGYYTGVFKFVKRYYWSLQLVGSLGDEPTFPA